MMGEYVGSTAVVSDARLGFPVIGKYQRLLNQKEAAEEKHLTLHLPCPHSGFCFITICVRANTEMNRASDMSLYSTL